jgi:hypothetical protein
MPRGDRTGPMSEGPRSGRGMGYCNGFNQPGFMSGGGGGGRGMGRGFGGGGGRGWRNRFYATGQPGWLRRDPVMEAPQPAGTEQEMLRNRADELQAELQDIRQRLDALEK